MGFDPVTSAIPMRAMKSHIESEVNFTEFISSHAGKWCEVYMK